jgi:transposase
MEKLAAVILPEEERVRRLAALLPRLSAQEGEWIQGMAQVLPELASLLQQKDLSLAQLQRLLFGVKSEKTRNVYPPAPPAPAPPKRRRRGHGRHGARDYTGAKRVVVPHPCLHSGAVCPECAKGKVRPQPPQLAVHVKAQPVFDATVFEMASLRCDLCGKTFTAPTPAEAGPQKYDPAVGPMLGLLRFGVGVPHYRLERHQADLGVPLPASTQWELMEESAQNLQPAFDHLAYLAAQASTLHNDDTSMRIGDLRRQIQAQPEPERTGIFTTSIVACGQEHPIALFFTGRRHAGENLQEILRRREGSLAPPIQMCDGLSRNVPKEFKTLLANCMAHARRGFVEVADHFPEPCKHVLETLRQIYGWDAQAKEAGLSPHDRLLFHQNHSQPVMKTFQTWLQDQLDQKKVEPNSGLGKAIAYMIKHWQPLTLFLQQPGAPLDNNIAERSLKMAILHRKNSLAFKTQRGAQVGDLFMSLIHTCRLNLANPFDYLVALVRNASLLKDAPGGWMPWNYKDTLASPVTRPHPELPTVA